MKKITILFLLFIPLLSVAGKNSDTLKFWVAFKDKANSPYTVDKPLVYLSQKAIDRRGRFGIKITEQDFPVNPNYVQQIADMGVTVLNTSRWLNGISIRTADLATVKKILALPFVSNVEKVGIYSNKDNSKMDYLLEFFMSLGGEEDTVTIDDSYYGDGLNQIQMLNGVEMHKLGYTGKGVDIAVLDGGFMNVNKIKAFTHLFNRGLIAGTWDFVNIEESVVEDNNHGMNVLSCMAAKIPGKMVGTAPDARYWLLRTEDANTEYIIEEYNWASGAEFADSAGVDIINSSLGYTTFDDESTNHTFAQLNGKTSVASIAAAIAAKKGIIICNAAGNEGNDPWRHVGAPADAFGIITVGGVSPEREHVDFSSYGPTADGRIKPTVCAQASKAYVASVSDGFYGSQGTSFASPILCGMVACLRQANPNRTVEEMIAAIEMSASKYLHPDTVLGSGIPNFIKANRYLGGDETFNYKKNQIETPPAEVFTNSISFTAFSPKYDNILFTLSNKKGEIVERKSLQPSVKAGTGFYTDEIELPADLSKGKYTLVLKIGNEEFSFNLIKE